MLNAYLDIETTGLSWFSAYITVIGIYIDNRSESRFIQLVGKANITKEHLLEALEGVRTIYTYNGSRFDLPFIQAYLGLDSKEYCYHHDLMYDCWRKNLYGGFKAVERYLGISRKLTGIGGFEAIMLWQRYQNNNDHDALSSLLLYNKEDVINLKILKEKLPNFNLY